MEGQGAPCFKGCSSGIDACPDLSWNTQYQKKPTLYRPDVASIRAVQGFGGSTWRTSPSVTRACALEVDAVCGDSGPSRCFTLRPKKARTAIVVPPRYRRAHSPRLRLVGKGESPPRLIVMMPGAGGPSGTAVLKLCCRPVERTWKSSPTLTSRVQKTKPHRPPGANYNPTLA